MTQAKTCVFTLTRGYGGIRKYRYRFIIRRNLALRKAMKNIQDKYDYILFHEGNIKNLDQLLIKYLSLNIRIKFIDISKDFEIPNGHTWTGTNSYGKGYSLMCRFNYYGLWKYLKSYKIAVRVDEDCLIRNLPIFNEKVIFTTGALSKETHGPTNQSLKKYLDSKGLGAYYDQKFPYTNVYITSVQFWLRSDVQKFLTEVARQENSLEERWGDLPILGVALKIYGQWNIEEGVDRRISYKHLSHGSDVANGLVMTNRLPFP